MTTLITGLNPTLRGWFAAANGRLYFTNGFDSVRVLTPDTGYVAGMVGPVGAMGGPALTAGGNVTQGTHLVRYRYKDSRTGYVSNPSDAVSMQVGVNRTATWTNGAGYVLSADPKCDTIIAEMTPVNGGNYLQAASVPNAAGTIVITMSDDVLGQQINSDAEYGSATKFDLFSHDPPPVMAVMVVQRGRGFVGVDVPYLVAALPSNGSPTVTGTGFSVNWVGRMFQIVGDVNSYEIIAATTTILTLKTNFVGVPVDPNASIYRKLPNRIFYSRAGYPEEYFPANWSRDVLGGRGDRLVAMWARRDALYLFGQYSSERLAFVTDPSAASSSFLPIEGNRGTFNQRCICEADGVMYSFDRQGIYRVGDSPKQISMPIDEVLREMADYTKAVQYHTGFEPSDRLLVCWFVRSGQAQPQWAAIYEIDTGRWWMHFSLTPITSSSTIPSTDGQVRLWQGDGNGYLWASSIEGSFDGVPPGCPSVVTVAAGSSAALVNVTETLTTAPGINGASVTIADGSETTWASANTATSITLVPSLAAAPAVGSKLYLGAIPWEYSTKWFIGGGLAAKKRPMYLMINVVPDAGVGTMRVYFYTDFDAVNPITYTSTPSSEWPRGVSIVNGEDHATIDLSILQSAGYIAVPLPNDWRRSIAARITSLIPASEIRVLDLQFVADEREVPNE
jgi:hypothetical protein